MANVIFPEQWRRSNGYSGEDMVYAAQWALREIDNPQTDRDVIEKIAREYMLVEEKFAWFVWQALADNDRVNVEILRELHQKDHWYLNILLVHHPLLPRDILRSFANLPKEIKGTNSYHEGYDKNEELRAAARKRLGPSFAHSEDG